MKHTPGPWTYFVGNANGRGLVRIETAHDAPEAGIHIASMTRGEESKANAALIAAAPELLEALKELLSAAKRGFSPYTDKAEQAIAKADLK